jgi:hypothetical protein
MSAAGTVSPRAFAVLVLITNWNRVGVCTGTAGRDSSVSGRDCRNAQLFSGIYFTKN